MVRKRSDLLYVCTALAAMLPKYSANFNGNYEQVDWGYPFYVGGSRHYVDGWRSDDFNLLWLGLNLCLMYLVFSVAEELGYRMQKWKWREREGNLVPNLAMVVGFCCIVGFNLKRILAAFHLFWAPV